MGSKPTVGVSILNCNFVEIKTELKILIESGIDFVHLDVMDGNFVDDITFGPSFVRDLIKEFPNIIFEVHMMVKHPHKFIDSMANAGVHRFIFHFEATNNCYNHYSHSVEKLIESIRSSRMEVALAINPETDVKRIFEFVPSIDCALIMTVHPGRGGQKFIPEMMSKCLELSKRFPNLDIEVDGGVGPKNSEICGRSCVTRIVSGSALVNSERKSSDVIQMRNCLTQPAVSN
ncbi:hypothetical protein NH340_JMT03218 [Sarcoptes scabiei]|nr:hypothetical protein NH340_JMT03218 [Sarcoptes scabiei]